MRMGSVKEDEADPLDDFFLVAGFDDLVPIEDDLETIIESKEDLKNKVQRRKL